MKSPARIKEAQELGFADNGNFFKKQPMNVTDKSASPLTRMAKGIREAFENFIPKSKRKDDDLVRA